MQYAEPINTGGGGGEGGAEIGHVELILVRITHILKIEIMQNQKQKIEENYKEKSKKKKGF